MKTEITSQAGSALRLAEKKIIVTAAASGMGRAGAEVFARHGATVSVVDNNAERAEETAAGINALGGTAYSFVVDLMNMSEARRVVHTAAERMGGLDGLWAHAGMASPKGIENLDMDAYRRCMDINVNSTVVTVIPVPADYNPCAQSRIPMDIIAHG